MNEEQKRKHTSDELVIETIMRTEHGRKWMWQQLQSRGVFETIFDRDPIKMAYSAGRRDSGVELDRSVKEASPGYYVKMIEENING